MQPAAVHHIGYLGNTESAEQILNGTFQGRTYLDEYTNKFLLYIGQRPRIDSFSDKVGINDFQDFWRSAKENTSSSMSNRHFGHYKSAAKNTILSTLHASFCNAASTTGVSIPRWEKGLTVMLEKIKNNIRVNKLRAILLMEADFNFVNKLMFGHRLMSHAKKFNRIPQELYGGLQNKSSQEVAINRRLTLDIFRLKRRNGAIAGVDATQCYDRIVHSLAILLARNEGAPLNPLLSMFQAIQSMNYYLRTTFGDSQSSYGGKQDVPFQGTCQGNGASPALWLMVSMYLVLLGRLEGHVSTFKAAYTGISVILLGFLFVDDTDLVILGEKGEDVNKVIERLQAAIKFWNGILRVSGGALAPSKCYWYLAHFTWNEGVCTINDTKP